MFVVTRIVAGHLALVAFLLAGYVSAFYTAQRIAQNGNLLGEPSRTRRTVSLATCVACPVIAAMAVYSGWHGPLIPQFVGGGINVTFFMAAFAQVIAKSSCLYSDGGLSGKTPYEVRF
jgi:hypothetical protein